jgi:NADH-quinone oxidoreductase subunit J
MTFPGSGIIVAGIFGMCIATTIVGALIAVGTTRIIRAVCGLAICCFGLAGLYYFLQSPFLALMEILIYVGAVCVTIVFAIMLAEPDEAPVEDWSISRNFWTVFSVLTSLLVFYGLTRLNLQIPWAAPAKLANDGSVEAIGVSLLTTYSMAFELISLVLLVAIIGALAIARTGKDKA